MWWLRWCWRQHVTPGATWAQKQFKYKNTSRFPSFPLPFGLALPSLWVGAGLNGKPVVLPPLTCEHRVPGGQGPSAGRGAVPRELYPIIPQPGKFLNTWSDRVWSRSRPLISVHGHPGWARWPGSVGGLWGPAAPAPPNRRRLPGGSAARLCRLACAPHLCTLPSLSSPSSLFSASLTSHLFPFHSPLLFSRHHPHPLSLSLLAFLRSPSPLDCKHLGEVPRFYDLSVQSLKDQLLGTWWLEMYPTTPPETVCSLRQCRRPSSCPACVRACMC